MNCGIFGRAFLAALLVPPGLSLQAAETAIIRGENTLVRSLPTRFSPAVVRLKAGEVISVLEEITLEKPAPDDELHWLKIVCPTNATGWVHGSFIDTNSNTVMPARLNVRVGPTENHPVMGRLERGQSITNLSVKGDWIEILPPPGSFAFVAASLVNLPPKPEPETPAVTNVTALVVTNQAVTNEIATVSNAPVAVPAIESTNQLAAPTPTPVVPEVAPAPIPPPAVATVVSNEPPKPRIVTREGLVSSSTSIQAPSHFKLENLQTHRIMDYLHSSSTNLALNRYVGRRVIVTGEEALDSRWPTMPVISIQRIQIVEE